MTLALQASEPSRAIGDDRETMLRKHFPLVRRVVQRLASRKPPHIDMDDLVGVILRALYDDALRGPVNATAPNPVTNAAFTDALGRALGRPTVLPVPALAVKAAFGQLGQEALLWGQRVLPRRLEKAGFRFFYEGVEDSLRFQLGKTL